MGRGRRGFAGHLTEVKIGEAMTPLVGRGRGGTAGAKRM
jgi:hypothetical protein